MLPHLGVPPAAGVVVESDLRDGESPRRPRRQRVDLSSR